MKISLNVLMVFVGFALVSCGNSTGSDDMEARAENNAGKYVVGASQLTVDKQQDIAVGSTVYVKFASANGSTGYWWYYKISDSTILQTIDEQTFQKSDAEGSDVIYIVRFTVVKPGNAAIIFNKYHSWEGISSSSETRTYNITAK